MPIDIHLRFQYKNPVTNTWENYPAGIPVDALDWDYFSSDGLASGQTNAQGQVALQVSDQALARAESSGPELYFRIRPGNRSAGSIPLPRQWDSRFKTDANGQAGLYSNFTGTQLGTAQDPLVFRISGIIAYLELWYYNQNRDRLLPCPAGVTVHMVDYDPRTANEILATTTTDAQGKVHLVYHAANVTQESGERYPDVYFQFNPMGIRDNGDPLPPAQDSRSMRSNYGGTGYYPEFDGATIGQWERPRRFVLGPKHFIRVGFVAVASQGTDLQSAAWRSHVDKLTVIQEKFKEQYAFATYGRSLVVGRQGVGVVQLDRPYPTNNREMVETQHYIAKKWYESHGDLYDYLAVYPETSSTGALLESSHTLVRNDVENIGVRIRNRTADYGSNGQLKGYGQVQALDELPDNYDFVDSRMNLLLHETVGHQYGIFGLTSLGMTPSGIHFGGFDGGPTWSFMYARPWRQAPNGKWYVNNPTAQERQDGYFVRFHPLLMYAMGLMEESEVPPTLVLTPTAGGGSGQRWAGPEEAQAIEATARYITIQEIIRVWGGPRRVR